MFMMSIMQDFGEEDTMTTFKKDVSLMIMFFNIGGYGVVIYLTYKVKPRHYQDQIFGAQY